MSEDFKYLGNNPGTQNVPFLDNVNVQKTVTNFNYSLWGASTKIYLKHVPASWSSDYQNVVQFESKSARDTYFKTNPPITLETEFRIGHDGIIRLPIPYDNLINYNYLLAEYPDAPVPGYQSNIARKQYFYFIKDCKYISPNTTEVVLDLDIWTSYLDEIEIANMQLERGHYPMTLSDVDSYLANPLLNRIGLDTMDVSFGDLCKISTDHQYNLYGDVFYLVATTSNPTSFTKNTTTYNGSPGSNKWNKGLYYFSVAEANWTTWVTNTANNTPAFFQTIKGILVMPVTLFAAGAPSFTFNGVTCYAGIDSVFSIDYTFTKADFGYDNKYQWLTKLYTSPYAIVELLDFNGNKQQIPYEDLYVGKFAMQLFFNIAIANPTARAVVLNIGGNGNSGEFNQIGIDIPVPSMSVNLSPNKKYMFETEYPRAQETAAINNSYNNAVTSAQTGKTIGDANANLSSNITKRLNDQSKDFSEKNVANSEDLLDINIAYNKQMSDANARIQEQSLFLQANSQQGAALMGTSSTIAANAAGVVSSGAATMMQGAGIAGSVNAASAAGAGLGEAVAPVGAMACIPQVAVGAAVLGVANSIGQMAYKESSAEAGWSIYSAIVKKNVEEYYFHNNAYINGTNGGSYSVHTADIGGLFVPELPDIDAEVTIPASNGIVNTNAQNVLDKTNENINYQITNSYSTAESNRGDTLSRALTNNSLNYNTTVGIAANNKDIALAGIQNAINQSYLNDNATYGSPGDHSKWTNGLMALHYHIKTQSDDAIRLAGDYFLRYGYAYNGNCDFSTFNIMKYYTFWKCQEVWLSSDKVNGNVIDRFKSILERGVTVWSNPADMGNVSIYDNTI